MVRAEYTKEYRLLTVRYEQCNAHVQNHQMSNQSCSSTAEPGLPF